MREAEEHPRTAAEIDLEILRLAKVQGALEAELGRWILLAHQARVHRHLGLASFAEYLELRLGYGPRLAHDKVKVAEALARLPVLKQALLSGARAWSTARELVRVATPGTEAEWLRCTEGKTVREVERQVAGHRLGDRPHTERDPLLIRHRRTVTLTSDQKATLRDAELQARRALGANVTDGELWAAIAEGYLGRGRRPSEEPGYQISLTVCAECQRSWRPAGGEPIEVSEAVHDCACCDGELVGLTPCEDEPAATWHAHGQPDSNPDDWATETRASSAPELTHVGDRGSTTNADGPSSKVATQAAATPRPSGMTHVGAAQPAEVLKALIRQGGLRAVLQETSKALGFTLQTVSRKLRQMVLARDQHRCTVPGCRNTAWIDLHHLKKVRDGGPNHPENLTTLCGAHHVQHHAGYLGIEGTPSTGLVFHTARGTLRGRSLERAAA